jgi:hypothetical protein
MSERRAGVVGNVKVLAPEHSGSASVTTSVVIAFST